MPEKTHDSLREEVIELTERIVIEYANITGRDEKHRAFFRHKVYEYVEEAIDSAYSAGIQKGLEMAVGAVPEEKKITDNFPHNIGVQVELWNACRSQVLDALEKMRVENVNKAKS